MFNKSAADKVSGYLKRMNDAIKACDKAPYDLALNDFNYFVNHGFEQNFDPFYKSEDDIRHNAPYRDARRAGRFPNLSPEYRKNHPDGYATKSDYDADQAALKAITPPVFTDVCLPNSVPVTTPAPHPNPKMPGLLDHLDIAIGVGSGNSHHHAKRDRKDNKHKAKDDSSSSVDHPGDTPPSPPPPKD